MKLLRYARQASLKVKSARDNFEKNPGYHSALTLQVSEREAETLHRKLREKIKEIKP